MRFNRHSEIAGKHAVLSPSYYHWLNYDEHKLEARLESLHAARRGTDLHDLAHEAIRLRVPLDESNDALACYVNDALELGMECEVALYYSENCFGHADTLSFRDDFLRVHDLKSGITAVKFTQLEVYDAIFCLEYGVDPFQIRHEHRIYQRQEVKVHEPTPEGISAIMDKIVEFDLRIQAIKEARGW